MLSVSLSLSPRERIGMVILNEVKNLVVSAFPFLSSSTFVIEDPASLSRCLFPEDLESLAFVAAASNAAFLFLSFVRRGEGR